MKPKNWNDVLALIILGAIISMWIVDVFYPLRNEIVLGTLPATFILVTQYYFRRAPPNGGSGTPP